MLVEMLQGKIHRASVTDCRLDYEGSLTVDEDLIDKAGLRVNQKVQVLNINNGERIETYLISGERGKRQIMVNGAAARLMYKGDRVIICGYGLYDENELKTYKPKIVVLDHENHVIEQH